MATTIAITDTITQVQTLIVEMPSDKLLQERYFPTGEMDIYDSKKLLIDYDLGDRKAGAFLRQGYDLADTTPFFSQTVMPPRVAVTDGIDTVSNDKDRQMFEKLCKQQGSIRPTRADAFNGLLKLKAVRCADRVSRSIERLCAMAFRNNAVQFQYDTSPLDDAPVTCDVQYYDPTLAANPQNVEASVAWGQSGATPYKDVCKAAAEVRAHGGRTEDLLLTPDAWDILREDMISLGLWNNAQIHMTFIANEKGRDSLFPEIMDYVSVMGDALFDGYKLKILVYNGGFEDKNGEWEPFLGEMFCCVTAPKIGKTMCGCASKVNPKAVVDYDIDAVVCLQGKYIATRHVSTETDSVSVRVESFPLPVPDRIWSFCTVSQPA